MASELPYFRFVVQNYQNGKISIESYEMQGLFYSICSYYWSNDCSITLATLKKKYKDATLLVDELIKCKIIKHHESTDEIEISFLNEQFDMLSEKRKAKQEAGSKGGKQRASNAKATLKQNPSYKKRKEKKIVEEKRKEDIILPFASKEFLESWELLLSQKKWKGKSIDALEASVKKLKVWPEKVAIKMITDAIAGEWQGIFEPKQNLNGGNKEIIGSNGIVQNGKDFGKL